MKRKKKYNPLKKYKHGGKHDTKPGKPGKNAVNETQAGQIIEDAAIKADEKEEDLMKGRTFIPRMSASQKASLLAGVKNLMEKRKDKKLFMEEGGTKAEYKDISKERKKIKRKEDLGLDTDMKGIESFKVEEIAQDVEDKKGGLKLKMGGKILKKYANGGKTKKYSKGGKHKKC